MATPDCGIIRRYFVYAPGRALRGLSIPFAESALSQIPADAGWGQWEVVTSTAGYWSLVHSRVGIVESASGIGEGHRWPDVLAYRSSVPDLPLWQILGEPTR